MNASAKVLLALAVLGSGMADTAQAHAPTQYNEYSAVEAASQATGASTQEPLIQLADGGKLNDAYMSGRAGRRYRIRNATGPQMLRGDQFITMMQSNTLSGTTAAGSAFNVYFLPGGSVTYQDAIGTRDVGVWRVDEDDDVCVAWQNPGDRQEGCFRVIVDGDKVAWEGLGGSGRATLRGGVAETFLKGSRQ